MCTATWLMTADEYKLFCIRDERQTRAPADPPALRELHGIRYHLTPGNASVVCRSRADARTVSFSHITVARDRIEFEDKPIGDPPATGSRIGIAHRP